MFSMALDCCVNSCFLAPFTSTMSLIRSYISITNRSSSNTDSGLISLGMDSSSEKASLTSGKYFQISQTVFFPLPAKAETVSHPVKRETLAEYDIIWDKRCQKAAFHATV